MQITSGNVNINQQDIRKAHNWFIANSITGGTLSTAVVPANRMIWAPLIVGSNDLIISHLAVNISVPASAGKKGRLGIYSNYPGRVFAPDKLLYDFGEVPIDGTGLAPISSYVVFGEYVTLPRNALYWVCMVLEEAATLYLKAPSTCISICIELNAPVHPRTCWRASRSYALGFPSYATGMALSDDAGYIYVAVL